MKYLFFDTETTGLPGISNTTRYGHTHSENGQPRFVELAWVKYIDKKATGGCDMFIRPSDFRMPAEVSRFNGITSQILAERGLEEDIILNAFMLAVKEADILVGHNISFDIDVITARLNDLGRTEDVKILESKPIICTMKASTNLCRLPKVESKHYDYDGEYKYPRLSELHRFLFGKDFDGAHGAQADTVATARCFFELVKRKFII